MIDLNHKKLNVYKSGIELVSEVYCVSQKFPDTEKFGLQSQLRRAAVSITSNISEGAARHTQKDRTHFYRIARSSLVEVDSQIEIALKLGYLSEADIIQLSELANQVFAMLSKMIKV